MWVKTFLETLRVQISGAKLPHSRAPARLWEGGVSQLGVLEKYEQLSLFKSSNTLTTLYWCFCVKPLRLHVCVDIVEGMVNKGIFLDGDNGGTFLHFGSYQNSCISDPTLCGPEGERAVVVRMITIFRLFGSDSPSLPPSLPLQGLPSHFFGRTTRQSPVLQ